jgi:hypothetical protein
MTITIVAGSAAYNELNAQPMVSFRNLLAEGTITDALLPSTAPRANAVTQDTSEFWAPTGTDTLRSTLGSAQTASVCFIGAHTLGSLGRTLTVERFNGTWQTITTYAPTNNRPFAIIFPDESRTGFGIGVNGACQIGVAWIGPRLVIPGGVVPDYTPVWAAERFEKFPGVTRRGHFRGQRIERAGASLAAQFMPISHTFALTDMGDFRDHFNEGNAFVWASAPSVFPRDVAYCWADQDKTLAYSIRAAGQLVNLSMQMEAYVERV